MGKKKSFKKKYFSEMNIPKDKLQQTVCAHSPEKAAKKLFRMFKKMYSYRGFVTVLSNEEEWIFDVSNWTNKNNIKFKSNKPWKKKV